MKRDLVLLIESAEVTPYGFTFRFPPDRTTVARVLDFVQFESACCREFGFEITMEPSGGPVWLRIRAAGEGKEALRAELIELGIVLRH